MDWLVYRVPDGSTSVLDDLSGMAGRLQLAGNVNQIAYFQSLQHGGLLPDIVGLQEAVLRELASGNGYSFKDCEQKLTESHLKSAALS